MNATVVSGNPIVGWISRQIEKGAKGFELVMREGATHALVDRYPAEKGSAESIYLDAHENAQNSENGAHFLIRAMNDGPGPYPSKALFLPPAMPLHEPERYEEKNVLRLLVEHIDKQNRVIAHVVPACLGAMGGMVQGLSSHFGTLAETHEAAIRALRDGRAESMEAERSLMLAANRDARIDKLLDAGIALLPPILEKLGDKK